VKPCATCLTRRAIWQITTTPWPHSTCVRHAMSKMAARDPEETDMPSNNDQRHDRAVRCALCEGKFGLIRYYSCRTALCSKKCVEHFKSRREDDSRWLWRFRVA
jgi:hypothetical protein